MTLTARILTAMALGIALGGSVNWLESVGHIPQAVQNGLDTVLLDGALHVIGKIFIASLKLLVVPLVFVSLVCGCASMGDNSRLGAIAVKTLALYMITTAIAISFALLAGNIIQPGQGIDLTAMQQGLHEAPKQISEAPPLTQVLINIFPSNPIAAMAQGNMLQVIVFSILTGLALSKLKGNNANIMRKWFESANDLVMKMVTILIALAPYGVFALLTTLFADMGFTTIKSLATYFAVVTLVLITHASIVYSGLLAVLARLNPLTLLSKMRSTLVFAFSTSSSNATLPVTLRAVEDRLGVDNKVASFTVPLGATINMDGTAIMQGVATAFIAQAYGIDISLSGYLMVVLTATLASVGTAGVPGVGLVTLAMVLQQVGLPVEGIALIIGVDRLLDMMRTAVNVTGDSVVSVIVANSEKALDRSRYKAQDAGTIQS